MQVVNAEQFLCDASSEFPEVGVELPLKSKLETIPRQLRVFDSVFKLRGAVAFHRSSGDQGVGHYNAFARRCDGSWELYDDLKEKIASVHSSTDIELHLLVYGV